MNAITTLDINWTGRPRSIAACLLESDGHAALLDPGPGSTLETLREGLRGRGLSACDLDALLLTHIHLDHSGACGALVRGNPRLLVYVHSKGAPHMADPSRLLASAGLLYRDKMQRLFGEFLAVPAENLRILEGGETLTLGARKLEVIHTPGHASHHVCYFDPAEGVAFVGDTTGIHDQGESFVLPVTPPPDIDLEAWERSLAAIAAWRPARLFLTHFGFSDDVADHMAQHRKRLHRWAALAGEIFRSGQDAATAQAAFVTAARTEIELQLVGNEAEHYVFNGGLDLSWLGLARYWRKRATQDSGRLS
jgi:glyoxylase-like metal-dependent hydrolase (beta-lactamase superfamily II)